MRSARQPILNLSGEVAPDIRFKHLSVHDIVAIRYTTGQVPFPSNTEGVLYYDQAKSQIRFRLCKTWDNFQQGKELVTPRGTA